MKQLFFKIKKDYVKMSDANFELKVHAVLAGLSNNAAQFPSPPFSIQQLTDASNAYSAALLLAKNRGTVDIAVKNESRQSVTVILNAQAAYCESVASTRSILLLSGFTVTSDARTSKVLGKPVNFTVTPGAQSGTVELSVDCDNAVGFVFMYALSPNTGMWMQKPSRTGSCTISGLTSLQKFDFKAATIGTNNLVEYTEVITKPVA